MHEKLAQGCGIFNSHFDRRLRERNIQDVQSLSVEMATAWVMHTSQLLYIQGVNFNHCWQRWERRWKPWDAWQKCRHHQTMTIQPEADGVCQWFLLSAKVGQIPFRWWRCLGRHPLTRPGMHGVWLAARRLCGRGLRVLHLIIAWPGWNEDAPRSWFHRCPQIVQRFVPKEKTKHVVVIREHRWPIIHQDHLASTEHYNQIQAALHRSEVKTLWRFMNLMNPLLLGTFVHALL